MVAVGESLAGYRITAPLGQGGFATVWRASSPDDREVALKVLRPEMAAMDLHGPSAKQRFLREARILVKLAHPGMVGILDVLEDEPSGLCAYAMELLRGADLGKLMKSIDALTLFEIGSQVADTLAFLHDNGVIHRDIKPANIFVTSPDDAGQCEIKLLDFGAAKEALATVELPPTATGMVLGTARVMAPEQFTRAEPSPLIDQWGLGMTLYIALSGRPPFSAHALPALIEQIRKAPLPALTLLPQHDPAVLPILEPVLRRMLEKDPAARYPHMRATAAALRSAGLGLLALRPGNPALDPVALISESAQRRLAAELNDPLGPTAQRPAPSVDAPADPSPSPTLAAIPPAPTARPPPSTNAIREALLWLAVVAGAGALGWIARGFLR